MNELFDYISNEDMLVDFFAKKKWQECADVGITLRRLWDSGDLLLIIKGGSVNKNS